ncbi:MAG: hypothetical protein ABF804_01305 [Liquorilactobacillus ghanensis]|uniref:hypothetical protein n=1 Tax=Liquorilactobacillus ghanensis TaxID=399370 RepID=UPI0039ECA9D1
MNKSLFSSFYNLDQTELISTLGGKRRSSSYRFGNAVRSFAGQFYKDLRNG